MISTNIDIDNRLFNSFSKKMSDHAMFYFKLKNPVFTNYIKTPDTTWVINDIGLQTFKNLSMDNHRLTSSWCGSADIDTMYEMWEKSFTTDFRASFKKRRINYKPST